MTVCRVPCIIAAPDAENGTVCRSLIELVDLYPTSANYCGVSAPHALAGQSLRPLLENPARSGKKAAFTLVTRGSTRYGQAVRTDRWRYIRWSDGNDELYDQLNDPQEVRDLSHDPTRASVIHSLTALLFQVGQFQPVDSK